jgi:two-component system, NarL family, captular synthesis response regulator RcsB
MRESMVQLRVVLADDHPFVLLGVRSALSAHQDILIVGEAANPASLIHLLQTVPCDVVVTDLTMPETTGAVEDGVSLVRRIRAGWPAVHVIVLTGLTNTAILRAVISDHAVSMLSKAESLDELVAAVRCARAGRGFVSRSVMAALAETVDESTDALTTRTLSPNEAEVIGMLVQGQPVSEIAHLLGKDVRDITRLKHLAMSKLGVRSVAGLLVHVEATG